MSDLEFKVSAGEPDPTGLSGWTPERIEMLKEFVEHVMFHVQELPPVVAISGLVSVLATSLVEGSEPGRLNHALDTVTEGLKAAVLQAAVERAGTSPAA
jgi:hypothetical protein